MQAFDQTGGLALGTVAFTTTERDRAFGVLDAWRTAGGRLIDTAARYGYGESESAIGAWLEHGETADSIASHPEASTWA